MSRSLRHPFGGSRRYLRPPKSAYRRKAPRRAQIPKFKMHPKRRMDVAGAMTSPEEMRSRPNLRLTLVGLIVLGLFAVMVLRLWSLQVINHKVYAAAVNGNTLRIATVPAPRGDVVDRNDTVLVGNTTQQEIVLSRAEASQHPSSIGQVAALVGETPQQVEAAVNDKQFSPYEPIPILPNAPAATVQYLEAHQSQYPGVSVQSVTQRSYPQGGTTATHILGYVSPITASELKTAKAYYPNGGYTQASQVGQSGLEAQYQQYLKGTDGTQYLEVNAKGDVVGTLRTVHPTQGDTLVSNVDLGLQKAVEQDLAAGIASDHQTPDPATNAPRPATNGAAIVMDVQTGSVLAMASYPSYDLNDWVGGITQANYNGLQAGCQSGGANAPCPLIDYSIQGRYTPGSTFKLNTATAALNDGLITPDTPITDNGSFTIPNCTGQCTFNDADAGGLGSINIVTALTQSSDVFFYNLGYDFWEARGKYGDTAIQDVAAQYSLGQLTGIDLPGEVPGQVDSQALDDKLHQKYPKGYPDKVTWGPGYNLEMAFGQGATVITPIEQAVAYATFANGGTRYQPQIASSVVNQQGKVVKTFPPKPVGHITYAPQNYAAMLQGFEGVINNGGTAAGTFAQYGSPAVHAMNLGGKTGTADLQSGEPDAWFVSFGPNPNPRYVVLAVVAQGGYGAQGAAPIVANIWNYLAANPISATPSLPTATKQPSATPPHTNPPAAAPAPPAPGTTPTTAPGTPAAPTTTPGANPATTTTAGATPGAPTAGQ